MKARKVGRGPAGFAEQGMPEQRLFQPGLIPAFRQRPADPRRPSAFQAIRNARLRDRTTASDLILAQAQLEPEPQHFCEFSHGQSFCRQCGFLLVSEEPGLPDSCPASLALTVPLWGEPRRPPLAPGREPNGSRPQGPSPHPGMIITIPGIVITMIPESLLRSFRNAHHDHFGIAITLPRNPQLSDPIIEQRVSRRTGSGWWSVRRYLGKKCPLTWLLIPSRRVSNPHRFWLLRPDMVCRRE